MFYFLANPLNKTSCTKRDIVSQIAKLFDPAGWLDQSSIITKIIMQQISLDKIDWHEEISSNCMSRWPNFIDDFPSINKIRIPRWVQYSPDVQIQFHALSDASEKTYSAALYIRLSKDDVVSTQLVAAKLKVAPIKTVSLPRLEFCGAVLVSDLVDSDVRD